MLVLIASLLGAASDRPNILLLFADDQRADTIGAWGNKHIHTPNVDRLAARGTSFRNAYCMGSNQGAVCIPSRAMLLSGRTFFSVPNDLKGTRLLPEVLRERGYRTFATGKWHNGKPSLVRAFPEARSVMLGGMNDHAKVSLVDVQAGAAGIPRTAGKFSSEEFADAAIDFLKSRDRREPFFLYAAFTAPHDPRSPPEQYRERYYKARPPLPPNFLPVHPFDNGANKGRDEDLACFPRTEAVIRDQLAEYYGLVTHLDEQIGRVLAALEETGAAANTLVVYAADNGLALGSHGLLGKQSLYEHSMKVPLIVAGPGVPAGQSSDAFVYLLDLFPTLCEAGGAAVPKDVFGHSLRPRWKGEMAAGRDSIFLAYAGLMRAVRDERWKLIVYPPINHRQLFDVKADPHEMHDLAGDPANAKEIERLTRSMTEWQAKVGDRLPLTVAKPKAKAISFESYLRQPDQWQPDWIRDKYFDRNEP
jgi:arylsulfatase A-like enzyme